MSKNAKRKARRYAGVTEVKSLVQTQWPVELLNMTGRAKSRERMYRAARKRHGIS